MDIKRIDQIRVQLSGSWSFVGRLLARINVYETSDPSECPTACTDGLQAITFNTDFIKDLNNSDMVLLMAHEMMHIILRATYGVFGSDVDREIWNIAEDIVINDILNEHYFESGSGSTKGTFNTSIVTINSKGIWPKNGSVTVSNVTIHDIRGKSVRDIYWELLRNLPKNHKGCATIDDHSKLINAGGGEGEPSKEDTRRMREILQQKIMQEAAAESKRTKGTVPGFIEGLVTEITEPKIPWRDRIRNAMMSSIITDTSYTKWNKRNCSLGTRLPGYLKEGLNAIIHLDTSGSTYNLLSDFVSEIKGIAELVPGSTVTVIQCDSDIQSVDDISADFEQFEAKGFGGTSHEPVVEYINKMETKPRVFISFTDGYSDIETCYKKLPAEVSRIICLPASEENMRDSLSQYGDVVVID